MALPLPLPYAGRQVPPYLPAPAPQPRRNGFGTGISGPGGPDSANLGPVSGVGVGDGVPWQKVEEFLGIGGTPQATPYQFDWSGTQGAVAGQEALLGQLQAAAAGEGGPSIAQAMLQQATDRNIRQAMALGQAQQGQGLGYASALRSIADASAAARQNAAGQGALLRAQEQLDARQQLGQLLLQMRGQGMEQQGMEAGTRFGYDQLNANIGSQNAAGRRDLFGGLLGAGGQLLMSLGMSDGGRVPGQAQALGDSSVNDTEPRMLSPGEIVLPRSIAMAPDAPEQAAAFVRALLEQKRQKRQGGPAQTADVRVRPSGPAQVDKVKVSKAPGEDERASAAQAERSRMIMTIAARGGDLTPYLTPRPTFSIDNQPASEGLVRALLEQRVQAPPPMPHPVLGQQSAPFSPQMALAQYRSARLPVSP